MYLPAHFAEQRTEVLHALIRDYPLCTLITRLDDRSEANHVPLHLATSGDGNCVLRGHLARSNPAWQKHPPTLDVLGIFQGPQAYVSPSWYPTKHEHGKAVPTWNYVSVHVQGRLQVIDDPNWLRQQLDILVATHESGADKPWAIEDAPADYIDKMLAAIVGIEISVTEMLGKWKISQNQPVNNRAGVVNGLQDRGFAGAVDMAALVASTLPEAKHE
jgi:transcriptional regulator